MNDFNYIDGIVVAVPTARKQEFMQYCQQASAIMKKYGALSCVDCWGEDVPDGKLTSLPMAVQAKADETVVLSWITWRNKKEREEGLEQCFKCPEFAKLDMIFDGKRAIFGGFEIIQKS